MKDTRLLEEIFERIKKNPRLYHPDTSKVFNLQCDASDKGIGAILTQENKILGIYGKRFTKQEENYSSAEKEILAVVKSLTHFKSIIYNSKTIIETDNKNITFNGPLSKRVNRLKLLIEEFDYELKHIEGNKNSDADLLSRLFHITNHENQNKDYRPNLPTNILPDKIKNTSDSEIYESI